MITLLIATRNLHKVEEIRAILGSDFVYLTPNEFPNLPDVIEDQPTFAGNAAKKSIELANWIPSSPITPPAFVLADDSGLEVDALNGAPGVYSARFAALDVGGSGNSPTAANNAKLLRLLRNIPLEQRTARFRCVVALTPWLAPRQSMASSKPQADQLEIQTEVFEGACEGKICFAPQGQGGFGYDPLFIPQGYGQTFAELGEDIKNRLSHRALALARLRQRLASLQTRP